MKKQAKNVYSIPAEQTLVIHSGTGVRCGTFETAQAASAWIEQLRVAASYKAQFYKTVNAREYWHRHGFLVAGVGA